MIEREECVTRRLFYIEFLHSWFLGFCRCLLSYSGMILDFGYWAVWQDTRHGLSTYIFRFCILG